MAGRPTKWKNVKVKAITTHSEDLWKWAKTSAETKGISLGEFVENLLKKEQLKTIIN